jgi:hypothetical protein
VSRQLLGGPEISLAGDRADRAARCRSHRPPELRRAPETPGCAWDTRSSRVEFLDLEARERHGSSCHEQLHGRRPMRMPVGAQCVSGSFCIVVLLLPQRALQQAVASRERYRQRALASPRVARRRPSKTSSAPMIATVTPERDREPCGHYGDASKAGHRDLLWPSLAGITDRGPIDGGTDGARFFQMARGMMG